jgi:hypothetical protein
MVSRCISGNKRCASGTGIKKYKEVFIIEKIINFNLLM